MIGVVLSQTFIEVLYLSWASSKWDLLQVNDFAISK